MSANGHGGRRTTLLRGTPAPVYRPASAGLEPAARGRLALHHIGVGVPFMRSYLRKYLRAIATSCFSLGWSTDS